MTEKQAIKILKGEKSWESDDRKIDAFILAIQALEEIQEYRELGTVKGIVNLFNNQRTIIATQHETLKQYREIGTVEELKAYKNGCCYETPCKVGATVWVIAKCKDVNSVLDAAYESATGYYCPYDMYNKCPHECGDECEKLEDKLAVFEDVVETIFIEAYGISVGTKHTNTVSMIGDLIFLSKEAADEALERRA